MIIVSDTSTIRYLVVIDQADLLKKLFGTVIITPVVYRELTAINTPPVVQAWMTALPTWIEIRDVYSSQTNQALSELDPGERSTIHTAEALKADLVLLDEFAGRQIAKARGLKITGLLGILNQAATRGLIEIEPVLDRLEATNFQVSPHLLQALRQKHRNRSK